MKSTIRALLFAFLCPYFVASQFLVPFEVPDEGRFPESSLFDISQFKFVSPSELSANVAPQSRPSTSPVTRSQRQLDQAEQNPSLQFLSSPLSSSLFSPPNDMRLLLDRQRQFQLDADRRQQQALLLRQQNQQAFLERQRRQQALLRQVPRVEFADQPSVAPPQIQPQPTPLSSLSPTPAQRQFLSQLGIAPQQPRTFFPETGFTSTPQVPPTSSPFQISAPQFQTSLALRQPHSQPLSPNPQNLVLPQSFPQSQPQPQPFQPQPIQSPPLQSSPLQPQLQPQSQPTLQPQSQPTLQPQFQPTLQPQFQPQPLQPPQLQSLTQSLPISRPLFRQQIQPSSQPPQDLPPPAGAQISFEPRFQSAPQPRPALRPELPTTLSQPILRPTTFARPTAPPPTAPSFPRQSFTSRPRFEITTTEPPTEPPPPPPPFLNPPLLFSFLEQQGVRPDQFPQLASLEPPTRPPPQAQFQPPPQSVAQPSPSQSRFLTQPPATNSLEAVSLRRFPLPVSPPETTTFAPPTAATVPTPTPARPTPEERRRIHEVLIRQQQRALNAQQRALERQRAIAQQQRAVAEQRRRQEAAAEELDRQRATAEAAAIAAREAALGRQRQAEIARAIAVQSRPTFTEQPPSINEFNSVGDVPRRAPQRESIPNPFAQPAAENFLSSSAQNRPQSQPQPQFQSQPQPSPQPQFSNQFQAQPQPQPQRQPQLQRQAQLERHPNSIAVNLPNRRRVAIRVRQQDSAQRFAATTTTPQPPTINTPRPANLAIAALPNDDDDDGIPGVAGVNYPTLEFIPKTSFSCAKQPLNGYYADLETSCQVVHVCQNGGVQDSFLCPNGTIFNQEKFSCQWWYEVNCADAPRFYILNDNLYKANANANVNQASNKK